MTSLKKSVFTAVFSVYSAAGNFMLAALVFALLALPQVAYSASAVCGVGFADGEGTIADPYQISSAKELDAVHNCLGSADSTQHFILTNNISLTDFLSETENGWKPIGDSLASFYGKIDGNGHKISGLWIDRSTINYVGLFGYLNIGARVENLGVEIDSDKGGVKGNRFVGGLAGRNDGSTVSNSYVIGNVSGMSSLIGGLIGGNAGFVNNSYATGSVSGDNCVGGLVGSNWNGIVSNSYAMGNVSGNRVGSLIGENSGEGNISNSYAVGVVSGDNSGSLVGANLDGSTISNSYYDKTIGIDKAVGSWEADTTEKAEGKTPAEMKAKSTFVDWDFETIWKINSGLNNGYPIFAWQTNFSLLNIDIDPIDSLKYAGNALVPEAVVKIGETELIKNVDYTLVYSNNVNVGMATITITGIGEYRGVKVIRFEIIKATPEYIVPTGLTAIYGQTLADVSLPNGWVWKELDTTLVGNVGVQSHIAIFTPADTLNYKKISDTLSINVSESTPIVISANSQIQRVAVQANNLHITVNAAASIEIYNAKGGFIFSQKFSTGNHIVSLASLPRGLYLAKAKFGSEVKSVRMVVK